MKKIVALISMFLLIFTILSCGISDSFKSNEEKTLNADVLLALKREKKV